MESLLACHIRLLPSPPQPWEGLKPREGSSLVSYLSVPHYELGLTSPPPSSVFALFASSTQRKTGPSSPVCPEKDTRWHQLPQNPEVNMAVWQCPLLARGGMAMAEG